MYLGDGVLYKDGNCELRFETPGYAREIRWNQGHLLNRSGSGGNFLYRTVSPGVYVPATNYVGTGAGQYRNGSGGPNQTLTMPFELAAGANPVFRPYAGFYIALNAPVSGAGGLSKYNDTGTLFLNATNTYSGNTVIRGGYLTLGAAGSISNSAVIDVQTGATFNVSSNTAPFVLQPAQTLKGNGSVLGSVIAAGTLSPGASLGTLTFLNDLTLAGNLLIEVNRGASPNCDQIQVSGLLTNAGGGTVTVTNIGSTALAAGDTFQIFNQPVLNGQALTIVSAEGVVWNNKLGVDGSIVVQSAPAPMPATNLTIQATGPTSFQLGGWGGANSFYAVFASTNVAAPMAEWVFLGSTVADGTGWIQFVDSQATSQQRYYRFGQ